MNRVYYRGAIDFCNYRCSYCPFAKRTARKEILTRERELLERLYHRIRTLDDVALMMTPYGEALIHDFYQEELARMAALPNVKKVGVQTNLSFDAEEFLRRTDGFLEKIALWATFHPECTTTDAFAEKANRLASRTALSAGMVATGENGGEIRRLRALLSPNIYLWLNAMDRRRTSFQASTIDALQTVDPMFGFEFARRRECRSDSGFLHCHSREHLYIDGGTSSSSCFFRKKHSIPEDCNDHRKCDCYLGYSNFDAPPMQFFFGDGLPFRVPERRTFRALFLDLDGVLTDADGKLRPALTEELRLLGERAKLYLATARNFDSARRILRGRLSLFSGGIFSDGAEVTEWEKDGGRLLFPVEEHFDGKTLWEDRTADGTLLRRRVAPREYSTGEKLPERLQLRKYRDRYYLQSAVASKKNGIFELLRRNGWRKEEIFFLSDNPEDAEVFRSLPYTAAPVHAEKASQLALCSLDVPHLAYLLR